MRSSLALLSFALFVAFSQGQFLYGFSNSRWYWNGIVAGQATTLTWREDNTDTLKLELLQQFGTSISVAKYIIGSGLENRGFFLWTPSTTLEAGPDYYIEISSEQDATKVAKSPYFNISNSNRFAGFTTDSPTSLGFFQGIISQLLPTQDPSASATSSRSIPNTRFTTLASPTTSNGATTQTSIAASTQPTNDERDPSMGLKLGIALSVIIGAIVLFILLSLLYRQHRRSHTNLTSSQAALPITKLETTVAASKAEPAADERERELPCLPVENVNNELSARRDTYELWTPMRISELPAGENGYTGLNGDDICEVKSEDAASRGL